MWCFLSSKIAQVRGEINTLRQEDGESLFDVWERFEDLFRLFMFLGLDKWFMRHTFYNDLLYSMRMTLDTAVSGVLMNNPYEVAYNLIEDMAKNHHL